jgi:hypothetical protein
MPDCKYSKEMTGLFHFDSIREYSNHSTCPKTVYSNPVNYTKCQKYLEYEKDGPPTDAPKVTYKPIQKEVVIGYTPKFTNAQCMNCTYKATSYCWGTCSFNIWKAKSDW